MTFDPKKSIERKSLYFGAAIVAMIGSCALTGLWAAFSLSGALKSSGAANKEILNHLTADMMHDAVRGDVQMAFLSSDPAFGVSINDVENDFRAHARTLKDNITLNQSLMTGDARRVVDRLTAPLDDYVRSAGEMVALAKADPIAFKKRVPEFQRKFEALETAMADAGHSIEVIGAQRNASANLQSNVLEILTLVLALIGVAASAILVIAARRQVVHPMKTLSDCIARLASGDISATTDFADRGDEIGEIARAVDTFRAGEIERRNLQRQQAEQAGAMERERIAAVEAAERIVVESFGAGLARLAEGDLVYRLNSNLPPAYQQLQKDFNNALGRLQEVLKSILHNAGSISGGTREISEASDNLSRRTEQQAASLEETAAALDEITATVSRTATGARTASEIILRARTEAEKSGDIVNSAVEAMSAIESSASKISQIIGVIDEIAFQTNLLALNAGVEAARAGDAGRGFAVVAQEVRALAQRSAEAAKEIKGLISASAAQVGEGVRLVDETGGALHRIVARVLEIDSVVGEIAASTTEQSTALHQINSAVNQMDQGTQQNAAMVEETTAATHSLLRETDTLVNLIQNFHIGVDAPSAASRPDVKVLAPRTPARLAPTRPKPARSATVAKAAASAAPAVSTTTAPDNWEEF